ncbi:MAG: GGDEF domain-containing protein, partial [Firmicutes bacterium]|nr:GGDEF domain-containing protein [Bacillota bacterium]
MKKAPDIAFQEFVIQNREKINRYLNIILWSFVITGPAIAIGIRAGVFPDIEYSTCVLISLIVIALAGIHLLLMKKFPKATLTGVFALTALNVLIAYMVYAHVSIHLTWFLVPMLSILFCDISMYFYGLLINYAIMYLTVWLTSPYGASLRIDHADAAAYFADTIGGYTIETIIMAVSGYIIVKLSMDHYRELYRQNEVIRAKEDSEREKMDVLDSMAEIYDNVNLISFVENTEMSLRDPAQKKHGIDMSAQTHTLMAQQLKHQVMPDQVDAFMTFTNIKTIRSRLSHKKLISADFIDVVSGWFRAQYITVDSTLDGIPNVVIYTKRNVDEEKRREENLIRISMTDEMTRLYNRRCYDEDLKEITKTGLSEDLVLFSVDVNGLKKVNDTKGHAAGDELIKGAADCLALSVGNQGKVYRTGGDEFMAIVHSSKPEDLRKTITAKAGEWHGVYTDEVTLSIGYASHKDNPDAKLEDLERIADED